MPPKRNSVETPEAPPHYHGHRERLRARFMEAGSEALADYEMLELVLFRAVPRRDVKPLAKSLLARFGSFAEVISAPTERLKEIDGLGEANFMFAGWRQIHLLYLRNFACMCGFEHSSLRSVDSKA